MALTVERLRVPRSGSACDGLGYVHIAAQAEARHGEPQRDGRVDPADREVGSSVVCIEHSRVGVALVAWGNRVRRDVSDVVVVVVVGCVDIGDVVVVSAAAGAVIAEVVIIVDIGLELGDDDGVK